MFIDHCYLSMKHLTDALTVDQIFEQVQIQHFSQQIIILSKVKSFLENSILINQYKQKYPNNKSLVSLLWNLVKILLKNGHNYFNVHHFFRFFFFKIDRFFFNLDIQTEISKELQTVRETIAAVKSHVKHFSFERNKYSKNEFV